MSHAWVAGTAMTRFGKETPDLPRLGVEPAEVDLVEVHDAAASAQLILMEELRLAEPGGALDLLRKGATDLDGELPVNPSGGLVSRGHPIDATGCAQLVS